MAKNTKQVSHYEIYTLRKLYKTMRGEQEVSNMVEVAIFDDSELAEAYKTKCEDNPSKEAGVKSQSYEIQSSWVENEPSAELFSKPFNPEWKVELATAKKVERVKKTFTPKQK